MKLSIQQSILSRHLDNAAKFLPKKETIPILSHIVLSVTPEGLEITAGNVETFIKSVIPADEFTLERVGSAAIPGKQLTEIIKKMDGLITIQDGSRGEVSISAGKSEFDLSALDTEEYPPFPEVSGTSLRMKGTDFKELIATTAYAVSDNEATPILTGILFNQRDGVLKLIACDRHRLAKIETENTGDDFQMVVGGQTLTELSKIIGDEEIEISFNNSMLVKSPEFTFYSRILEGTYPDTDRLIPTSFKTELTVNKHELSAALERILIIAKEGKTHTVKITIGKDEIKIESKEQSKRARESIDVTEFRGEQIVISVNGKYLSDALKAISATDVHVKLNDRMSPIILQGKDELGIALVLPYRTGDA